MLDIDLMNQNIARARLSSISNKAAVSDQKAMKEARLKEACAGFEAIFLNTILKSMRSSLPGDAILKESNSLNIYKSMQDQYLAEDLSKGKSSIGLREFLFQQMKDSL